MHTSITLTVISTTAHTPIQINISTTNINIISTRTENIIIKKKNIINTITHLIHTEVISIIIHMVTRTIIISRIFYVPAIAVFIITILMLIITTDIITRGKKHTGEVIKMDITSIEELTS